MTIARKALKLAVKKGYRVTGDGKVLNPDGEELTGTAGGRKIIGFAVDGRNQVVPAHRLQAYQMYGDKIFKKGFVVKFRNGNTLDCSTKNIYLHGDFEPPKNGKNGKSHRKQWTDAQKKEIFEAHTKRGISQPRLAKKYKTTAGAIGGIVSRYRQENGEVVKAKAARFNGGIGKYADDFNVALETVRKLYTKKYSTEGSVAHASGKHRLLWTGNDFVVVFDNGKKKALRDVPLADRAQIASQIGLLGETLQSNENMIRDLSTATQSLKALVTVK